VGEDDAGGIGARQSCVRHGGVNSSFSDFQKSEYDHIAEAHFKAIEAITFFFRYYLLVMSLPATLFAVLFAFAGREATGFEKVAISLLGLCKPILYRCWDRWFLHAYVHHQYENGCSAVLACGEFY
jgi:hypothetical protein